ncbi:signal peptidase I [Streptomyces sp. Qhu-G9]|uniref:signal peptidase I n=1 Tax=Streptomyces sp. Qhu-G9 TaxID=3452799 RepID=UPI0022AC8E22|nr:signal peptidase I [Streptomyces aurantiacus]WAU79301.1 signal peptidase I [Streptomyces aurantiacus]
MREGRRLALTAWVLGPLGLVLLIGTVLYVRSAYTRVTVVSSSMSPTYTVGERLVVELMDGHQVRRGDVVLVDLPSPDDGGPVLQRVVGVGGDRVACCEGSGTDERVTLDGRPLQESYVQDGVADGIGRPYDLTVPQGRLFLLGDHRVDSLDSRFYGTGDSAAAVSAWAVRGRVVDGPGGAVFAVSAAVLGVVLALVGLGCGISARVVRRRPVPPPRPVQV